jgi:hypothetical protein
MIRDRWLGKDFLGSECSIIETLSWYLPSGTEENHYIFHLFLEKCIYVCVREILTLSFASLSLECVLHREAEVCFLALFVERIFKFLETGSPVQRIFDNFLK